MAGPVISRASLARQYVTAVRDSLAVNTYGHRYVFAGLSQTTVSLETRLDWTFAPTLSLQLYAQPFVASGNYRNFGELPAARARTFAVYGRDAGIIALENTAGAYQVDPDGAGAAAPFLLANPDFTSRSLQGNAVLRWEWRPGSELYLVWQQLRSGFVPEGQFDLGRDTGALFRAPATNVFVVKTTYWMGR